MPDPRPSVSDAKNFLCSACFAANPYDDARDTFPHWSGDVMITSIANLHPPCPMGNTMRPDGFCQIALQMSGFTG